MRSFLSSPGCSVGSVSLLALIGCTGPKPDGEDLCGEGTVWDGERCVAADDTPEDTGTPDGGQDSGGGGDSGGGDSGGGDSGGAGEETGGADSEPGGETGDDSGGETGGDSGGETGGGETGSEDLPAARWSGETRLPDGTELRGQRTDEYAGSTLATGGDINGDGNTDLVVGAILSTEGASNGGIATVVFGPITADQSLSDADLRVISETADSYGGWAVAMMSDQDGDGADELLVSAPGSSSLAGAACLVPGGTSGDVALTGAGVCWTGEGSTDAAGGALVAGDYDGDGVPDVGVGADRNSTFSSYGGAAYVVYGPADEGGELGGADVRIYGSTSSLELGSSAAMGADLDGDGVDELVVGGVGYSGGGTAGSAAFVFTGPPSSGVATDANAIVYGHRRIWSVGERPRSLSTGADVDGDGTSDLVIGAYGYQEGESDEESYRGAAFLVSGAALSGSLDLTFATATLTGEEPDDGAGYTVEGLGDLDGDGYGDVAVGAPNDSPYGSSSGSAYLVYGPLRGSAELSDSDAIFRGDSARWRAGMALAGGFDLTGDGVRDLVLGADGADGDASRSGVVFLLPGVSP